MGAARAARPRPAPALPVPGRSAPGLAARGRTPRALAGRGRGFRALAAALLLSTAAARPAPAQLRAGSDVAFLTRYEWRGLRLHDGAVLQPSLFVAWEPGAGSSGAGAGAIVTAGVLGTWEMAAPSAPTGLGFGAPWGEIQPWIEVAVPAGPFDLAAGWTAYLYDVEAALGPAAAFEDTHELYARARATPLPAVTPELAAWLDVDEVRGAYLEGRVLVRVPLWPQVLVPVGSLFLVPRIGASLGQEEDPERPVEAARFAERGVTHWGASALVPIGPIPLGRVAGSLELGAHLEWKEDPRARLADATGRERERGAWLSLTLTLLGPRCRPEREICEPWP